MWARRAAAHHRAGKHKRALADATRALELEPRHFGALALRGDALRGLKRYVEAAAVYEETLRRNPWATGVVTDLHRAQKTVAVMTGRWKPRGSSRASKA